VVLKSLLLTPDEKKKAIMQGLLAMGAGMMRASGPSPRPVSFGSAMGAGIQQGLPAYQHALNQAMRFKQAQSADEMANTRLGMEKERLGFARATHGENIRRADEARSEKKQARAMLSEIARGKAKAVGPPNVNEYTPYGRKEIAQMLVDTPGLETAGLRTLLEKPTVTKPNLKFFDVVKDDQLVDYVMDANTGKITELGKGPRWNPKSGSGGDEDKKILAKVNAYRSVYETSYPKSMFGERVIGAPDFNAWLSETAPDLAKQANLYIEPPRQNAPQIVKSGDKKSGRGVGGLLSDVKDFWTGIAEAREGERSKATGKVERPSVTKPVNKIVNIKGKAHEVMEEYPDGTVLLRDTESGETFRAKRKQ
jgi:hypothetical protein